MPAEMKQEHTYGHGARCKSRRLDVGSVARLEPLQAERLAVVLGRTFCDEPNFRYLIPDQQARLRLVRGFFHVAIRASQLYGEIYTTQTVAGGAVWISPGRTSLAWQMIQKEFLSMPAALGWANVTRGMNLGTCLEEVHSRLLREPHWYLMTLGMESAQDWNCIGRRLIKPVLARADSGGVPCYLETFNEKDLPFYKTHGFRIIAAGGIPGGGPDFWAMVRPPAHYLTSG